MAKQAIYLYHSYLAAVEPLGDAECGRLFKSLLTYSMTGVAPELNGNERFLFPMMQDQIDRDNLAYEEKCAKNRGNAQQRTLPNASERKRPLPNASDGSQGEGEGEREGEIYRDIVEYLNAKTGRNFKPGIAKTRTAISARLNEGFTLEDFYSVIDKKAKEWGNDPKMQQYLRPETLFGTKFESYLNANPVVEAPNRNAVVVGSGTSGNLIKRAAKK